jgi:hypothetical protein
MEDRMADSEMLGDIQADGIEEAGKFFVNYIEGIRDWLKNLAEDRTQPMDVKVHNALWAEIQSIDHDIETKFQEVSSHSSTH